MISSSHFPLRNPTCPDHHRGLGMKERGKASALNRFDEGQLCVHPNSGQKCRTGLSYELKPGNATETSSHVNADPLINTPSY